MSSVAGERGRPRNFTYGAAKGALNVYLQGLRTRLGGSGVRVHTFKLGPVDTPMTVDHRKTLVFARAARRRRRDPGDDRSRPRRSVLTLVLEAHHGGRAFAARACLAADSFPGGSLSMAIKELTPEQVRSMSLEEKDRWWRAEVYKGDLPQLTIRSALTGMILGGVLSLTNIYVGIKTGWTLGVGITSVIISYAAFKLLSRAGIGREMTILENNAMQSIATSAGYMTLAAGIVDSRRTCWSPARWCRRCTPGLWIALTAVLGVLFAFPLKKRFINDEQLPFPEGYAAGVVMDSLHSEQGREGLFKAKLLAIGGVLSGIVEVLREARR